MARSGGDSTATWRPRGPAQDAVAARLAELWQGRDDVVAEAAGVEAARKGAPGEILVDLTRAGADGATPPKVVCRELAAELGAQPWVERAVCVPPRIFVRVALPFLAESVTAGVVRRSRGYGGQEQGVGEPVVVSFCSPNTNKSLHVGHLRVCALGMSISRLFEAAGFRVQRSQFLSNYGVHICQALVAYLRWGEGSTPESTGRKGDHFVGSFYARFHQENTRHTAEGDEAEPVTELDRSARDLLLAMEAGDEAALELNERITEWAARGIAETYRRIGVRHELEFREGDSLPLAKDFLVKALAGDMLGRRDDGSVYVDLTDVGLGRITLRRSDATPLVFTQFLGIWLRRRRLLPHHRVVLISGDQWKSGVDALVEMLCRFGIERPGDTEGVPFGMLRLAEGQMKSREGTVVAADDLLDRLRDRLLAGWAAVSDTPMDHYHARTCETLAAGLTMYYLLEFKRLTYVTFDEEVIWEQALPRFALAVGTLADADRALRDDGVPESRAADCADSVLRALLHHLDAFPSAVAQALDLREPSVLVRHLNETCQLVVRSRRSGSLDRRTWAALLVVLRRSFELLNVALPPSFDHLPPDLGRRAPRGPDVELKEQR